MKSSEITKYLQEYVREHNVVPRACDFNEYAPFSLRVVFDRYGTWNEFVQAAGFSVRPRKKYTKDQIVKMLNNYYDTNGLIDFNLIHRDPEMPSTSTIADYFGSFNEALKVAGIPVNEHNGTRRRLPTPKDFDKEAVMEDVLQHRLKHKDRCSRSGFLKYSDEELLDALRICYERYGAVTQELINSDPELPSTWPYSRSFRTFRNAKILAGIPMTQGQQVYTVAKDGHVCDSAFEAKIDNWLFKNEFIHEHQVKYPGDVNYVADFAINDILVEAAGLTTIGYRVRLAEKIEYAGSNNILLVVVYPTTSEDELISLIEIVALRSNPELNTPLIAGNSLEPTCQSGAGNGGRNGLKSGRIGCSAAKTLSP